MPILHWLTRDADLRTAVQVPFRLLTEEPALSHGTTASGGENGLLVQGDNLEALKALLPFYAGRVKCIYIDPPYNTRSAFEHYDDNLEHAQWLGMIVPRLMLLREFLSEDGSIWISIDEDEYAYLKVLCDEVFFRRNFVASLVWQKRYAPDARVAISDAHEYVLCYARDPAVFKASRNLLPLTHAQTKQFRNPDNDPRGPWKADNFTAPGFRANQMYEIVLPSGRKVTPPDGRCWRVTKSGFDNFSEQDQMYYGPDGNGAPSVKRFLSEMPGMVPWTWWGHEEAGHSQEGKHESQAIFGGGASFSTPKPERLIQRILHIATNPGDLVLDSFLGSGTTAAVAHKMGRAWIGVEMGDHARTHCATRLRKVIDGEGGGISKDVGWQGGGGFRFVTLGPRIYDENGVIAPEVRFADLARHVWFTETRRPLDGVPDTPLLGIVSPPPRADMPDDEDEAPPPAPDRAVALLFNGILRDRTPQGGNVLTRATLALIREDLPQGFAGTLTVYATACRLSPATLKQQGVQFRQTPYDLNAGVL